MSFLEELYSELTDKEREFFSETVNLLFGKTYLVYERKEDRRHYRFVEKHLELFQHYLEMADWSVQINKQEGVIQFYNMEERNRRTFTLQETIFLFILRLLYDEKKRSLRLTGDVTVTGQEIQEKYLALQIKNRLPAREVMQRILKMFGSFSLLDLKRGHWREPDAVYVLYPSILLVLDTSNLESLAEWLRERAAEEVALSEYGIETDDIDEEEEEDYDEETEDEQEDSDEIPDTHEAD